MIKYINLPRAVCNHVLGKEHSTSHRMVAGVTVMTAGVGIAKSALLFHSFPAHFTLDMIGYLVHGLGAVPFIEHYMDGDKHE